MFCQLLFQVAFDFILVGQKIVIPESLRAEVLKQVHTGHLGVTKTLERAKDNIFWPGMTNEIQDYVLQKNL